MKIFIWGAGGQGRVVLDILRTNNQVEVIGFVDSDENLKGKFVDKVRVLGGKEILENLKKEGMETAIIAIGNNQARCEVADFLRQNGFSLSNAIHSTAIIASNVSIGKNVTIAAGATICTHSVLEDDVIINTGAIVEHENIIKTGVHIAPGVQIAGRVKIGEKAFVGIGATLINDIEIGKNSIIGAGSVVLNNVEDNMVVAGVPAKIIKKATEQDLMQV